MSRGPVPDDSALLEQLHWLRALAFRLAGDSPAAEDAVQETALAALSSPPRRVRSLRGWLAATLRHALGRERRTRQRRREREAVRATDEASSVSAFDSAAEVEAYGRLLDVIGQLDEPYRTVVLRRFARGESPAEIAAATRAPLKTVHTRIRRGVERLRLLLGREYADEGGLAGFCAIVGLPFALPAAVSAVTARHVSSKSVLSGVPPLLTGLAMQKNSLVAGTLLCALGFTVWWANPWGPVPLPEVRPAPASSAAADAEVTAVRPGEESVRLDRVPIASKPPVPPTDRPASRPDVDGAVFGLDGRPLASVQVGLERLRGNRYVFDDTVAAVSTNALGRFAMPLPDGAGRLTVVGPELACAVHVALTGQAPSDPVTLVAARSIRLRGRVVERVDGRERPVAGVRLTVEPPADSLEVLGALREVVAVPETFVELRNGDDGAFDTNRVAWMEGASLHAERDGFITASIELQPTDVTDLLVVLERSPVEAEMLRGLVLDSDGRPVDRATVSIGNDGAQTDPAGRFTLPPPASWHRGKLIWAAKVGLGATSLPLASLDPSADIVLRIDRSMHAIRGVVVDAHGEPVPEAVVWTPDTTYLGSLPIPYRARTLRGIRTLEAFLAEVPRMDWSLAAVADSEGRFVLQPLDHRAYDVFALDPRSLEAVGPSTVVPTSERAQGDGVVMRIPSMATRQVAGRLVGPDGRPIAGARIRVGREMQWQRPVREVDPWAASPVVPPGAERMIREPRTLTDEDGRFILGELAVEGVYISADHPSLNRWEQIDLDEVDDPTDFEWRVEVRSTFRIVLQDPDEAGQFSIQAADGGRVPLFLEIEDSTLSVGSVDLVAGRSPTVYSRAQEVVVILQRDGVEVRRGRLRLPPGGVHDLVF